MSRVMPRRWAFFVPPTVLGRLNHMNSYKYIDKFTNFCNENSALSLQDLAVMRERPNSSFYVSIVLDVLSKVPLSQIFFYIFFSKKCGEPLNKTNSSFFIDEHISALGKNNIWKTKPFIGNSSSLPWLSVGMALDRRDLSKWTCPVVVSTFVDSSLISLACASLKSDELSQEELKGLTWLRGALFQTKLICRLSSAVAEKFRDKNI